MHDLIVIAIRATSFLHINMYLVCNNDTDSQCCVSHLLSCTWNSNNLLQSALITNTTFLMPQRWQMTLTTFCNDFEFLVCCCTQTCNHSLDFRSSSLTPRQELSCLETLLGWRTALNGLHFWKSFSGCDDLLLSLKIQKGQMLLKKAESTVSFYAVLWRSFKQPNCVAEQYELLSFIDESSSSLHICPVEEDAQ